MTIYVKKLQKTTLNVFAGTVGECKRLEALEIIIVSAKHDHEYVYTDNGDGTHTGKCTICGETLTEDCSYKYEHVEGTEGNKHHQVCSVCGYINENSEQECTFGEWITTPFVTSDNRGTHSHVCSICGYETQEEEHNYGKIQIEYKNHTQTEKGGEWATMTCQTCGYSTSWWFRPDLDFKHEWKCTTKEDGTHTQICKICGIESEKGQFEIKISPESEATCPKHGYVGQINCSLCKQVIQNNQKTRMYYDKSPTCTENGYKNAWICQVKSEDGSICKEILCGKIYALGHEFNQSSASMNSGDGTITRTRKCNRCHKEFDVELLDKEEEELNKEKEEYKETLEDICKKDEEICADTSRASENNMKYTEEKLKEIEQKAEEAIKKAKNIEQVENELQKAEAEIEALMKLFEAKDAAILDLHSYFVKLIGEHKGEVSSLTMLFYEGDKKIAQAEDQAGVKQFLEEIKTKMSAVVTED